MLGVTLNPLFSLSPPPSPCNPISIFLIQIVLTSKTDWPPPTPTPKITYSVKSHVLEERANVEEWLEGLLVIGLHIIRTDV